MTVLKGGFTPVKHLTGCGDFVTVRMAKDTSLNDASLVYVGDAVRLTSSGKVARLLAADTSASGPGVFGVVARVLVNENGRPRVHGLSNNQHPNISLTADADWLDVYVDPGIVYSARVDASAGASWIGKTFNVTAAARVTAAGISGMQLAGSTAGTSAYAPFKVLAISDFQTGSHSGDANGRVEVIVNYSPVKNSG